MRLKRPQVATPDEVRITREGNAAIIEYKNPGIATTHFELGPEVAWMTDQQILDTFNATLRARDRAAAAYVHIAVEIPSGRPQIEYHPASAQWVPRGDVLRCVVESDEQGEAIVHVDEQELSLREFGRLLTTYGGWGMRIAFVPDDELEQEPRIEVREPEGDEKWLE